MAVRRIVVPCRRQASAASFAPVVPSCSFGGATVSMAFKLARTNLAFTGGTTNVKPYSNARVVGADPHMHLSNVGKHPGLHLGCIKSPRRASVQTLNPN